MHKRNYDKYTWKNNKLFYFDTDTGARLMKDRKYPNMYRFRSVDNIASDIFNLVRAKDNGIKDTLYLHNQAILAEGQNAPLPLYHPTQNNASVSL
jgi:hypothetical protein